MIPNSKKTDSFFLSLLSFVLILSSCQKATEPISDNFRSDTTSHNFTWTADTIFAEDAYQIYLYDIWGRDENNVWAVGHSDRLKYRIWHYDGKKWSNVYVPAFYHVPTYREIFGFSENDFWVVGYGVKTNLDTAVGYILHYDGEWRRMDNYDLPICFAVWGTSSDNMYFGCYNGVIAKYDGEKFIKYKTGRDIQFRSIWGFNDTTIFVMGTEIEKNNKYFAVLYKYTYNRFTFLDSSRHFDKGFGMDLWGYDMDNFYSAKDGVYKYNNGRWIREFKSTTIYTIFGNAPNNVFAGGFLSTFYHYNGDNWEKINFGDDLIDTIRGIWSNDDHVFVIQHLGYYSRILHGVRKN
ncbi:hypothetical protein Calab_0351 [Caldithrix abyssi DSM 13497]|uniref:Glucosyl transferase n=1 Tax=Caldithrix abyssi DSM 13497 TaxID=880073 RepID=H1XQB0_CALAY|nr:hypothetical protein [Caldithrix abyssi]APF19901.1 hypothetical protein Cabys_3153 [Caldithrix abyssi DSM 13497]EHO39997.1 hypothetical protein Calab_0351 [Caldithrix abyssi DSM 13497]